MNDMEFVLAQTFSYAYLSGISINARVTIKKETSLLAIGSALEYSSTLVLYRGHIYEISNNQIQTTGIPKIRREKYDQIINELYVK